MKGSRKYRVWECKIVVEDQDLPNGFDGPPRVAAIDAIQRHAVSVLSCFSGWGGKLTRLEERLVDHDRQKDINHSKDMY